MPRSKTCKLESLIHFSYTIQLGKHLGFPMLTSRVKNSDLHFILDKINGRLTIWKMSIFIVELFMNIVFLLSISTIGI